MLKGTGEHVSNKDKIQPIPGKTKPVASGQFFAIGQNMLLLTM